MSPLPLAPVRITQRERANAKRLLQALDPDAGDTLASSGGVAPPVDSPQMRGCPLIWSRDRILLTSYAPTEYVVANQAFTQMADGFS